MNDSHALITSMNLYEFSQQNNDEMGILVSAEDDPKLYKAIKAEADHILRLSKNVRLNVTLVDGDDGPVQGGQDSVARTETKTEQGKTGRRNALPELGFCLRCGAEISFDQRRPYCGSDYRSWARFKNEEYEEKHCHACGEEHATSMAKPVSISCYRKYRGALSAAG